MIKNSDIIGKLTLMVTSTHHVKTSVVATDNRFVQDHSYLSDQTTAKKKMSRTLIKQNFLEYNFHFSSNPFVSCTLTQDLYLLYLTMLCFFRHVLDIWKTMAGESNLSLSIFDYILDLSLRSLPYQEKPNPKNKKETIRVATAQPTAVSYDTFLILGDRCTLLGSNYFLLLFLFFTVIVS